MTADDGIKIRKLSSRWTVFILFILTLVIIVTGWSAPKGLNWIFVAISMFMFIVVLGLNVTGRTFGILINERKLMSLSRFQIVLWTLIILSAFFTIAMERIRHGESDPLAIKMDWQLWALIGIGTTSLVGTPMIQSVKKSKEPHKDTKYEVMAKTFNETPDDINKNREGILYGNKDISDAQFTDIFEGDELANTPFLDMAKVQMFFFTIIAALSYVIVLFNMIVTTDPKDLNSFPVLPEGLIAILGISHAGYLSDKAIDHTKTE